jgi:hypothetical protein
MTKKSAAKPKAAKEQEFTKATEPEATATSGTQRTAPHVVSGLPKFNFNARPITAAEEAPVTDTPVRPSYESIQQQARGPGADEWRQLDKARAELTGLYNSLREDERYAPEYKSERAWSEYEKTKAKIEQLAPEAHKKMLRSAEGLERQSIPTPEGEGLITKDTNKRLLTVHERSRLESLINRAKESAEQIPKWQANPFDLLKHEYARGLEEGGPGGGATVRAVYELARDWDMDIHAIVDDHRKPRHHEAFENAEQRLMQAELVGRHVPEPPFKRGGTSPREMGTYGSRTKAFMPQESTQVQPKKRKPYWR